MRALFVFFSGVLILAPPSFSPTHHRFVFVVCSSTIFMSWQTRHVSWLYFFFRFATSIGLFLVLMFHASQCYVVDVWRLRVWFVRFRVDIVFRDGFILTFAMYASSSFEMMFASVQHLLFMSYLGIHGCVRFFFDLVLALYASQWYRSESLLYVCGLWLMC